MSNKLILVLNCGSSSLKFAIIDTVSGEEKLTGLSECLELENASIKWKLEGVKGKAELGNGAHHKFDGTKAVDVISAELQAILG